MIVPDPHALRSAEDRARRPEDAAPATEGSRRARIAVVALLAVIGPLLSLCHFMNGQAPWSSPVRFRGLPPVEDEGRAADGRGRVGHSAEGAPLWDDVDGLVVFGGDVMQHARQRGEDFDRAYSLVAPVLARADVAVVNLEFPVHPGRPVGPAFVSVVFNGETAHLAALARAGVDVVSLANNHAFDQGVEGLVETIRQARAAGLRVLGITADRVGGPKGTDGRREGGDGPVASPSGACAPLLCEVGASKVALVAATYDVNLPPTKKKDAEPAPYPRDFPLSILPLNDWWGELASWGRIRIRAGSEEGRRRGAASVVAFLHWGREWDLGLLRGQAALAREASSLGLSAIVGSHAHVPGPAATGAGRTRGEAPSVGSDSAAAERDDGGRPDRPLDASVPVAFGLGNFCSDFRAFPTRVGGLVHLGFRKGRLVRWGILPLLVLPEDGNGNPLHAVLPLDETRRTELVEKASSWGRKDVEKEWERARALVRPLWKTAFLPAPPRVAGEEIGPR